MWHPPSTPPSSSSRGSHSTQSHSTQQQRSSSHLTPAKTPISLSSSSSDSSHSHSHSHSHTLSYAHQRATPSTTNKSSTHTTPSTHSQSHSHSHSHARTPSTTTAATPNHLQGHSQYWTEKIFHSDCHKLYEACHSGDIKTVRTICHKYQQSQCPVSSSHSNEGHIQALLAYRHLWLERCKYTPLHIAVNENHYDIVEYLISTKKVFIDITNDVSLIMYVVTLSF